MQTTPVAISRSARARSGNSRRASSSSSPLGCGRTELTEIRHFLSAIFRDDERIHFFPILREEFVTKHTDDPGFPESLHGHKLVYTKMDRKNQDLHRVPLHGPNAL